MHHSTYYGINIWRQSAIGRLRYTALTTNGQLAADTLDGIRSLILKSR